MAAERFIIRCPDWTSGIIPSRESAERRLAGIVASADCPHLHEIVPVDGTQEVPMNRP